MSDFDGIENAEVSGKLPNLNPGRYTLEVQAVKLINSRAKGKLFISEFRVLEAEGAHANEKGSLTSWIVKMSLDTAKGNIKGFVAALTNEPLTQVTASMCDELVSEAQPAKGFIVRADAVVIKTKANTDFTKVTFSPGPATT